MTSTYTTQAQFEAAIQSMIAERIPSRDSSSTDALRSALVNEMASGIADANRLVADDIDRDSRATLDLRLGRWFVRDDDLGFFESIGVVGTLFATFVTSGVLALPAAVAGAATLAGIGWKIWRKGGRLSRDQVSILTVLKAEGPASRDQIVARLKRNDIALYDSAADDALAELEAIELFDGTEAALVQQNAGGLWRAVGV